MTLEPFVCVQGKEFEHQLRQGWSIVETHQAFLYPDGTLELDTDFEHRLSYRCDASRDHAEGGEGWSQLTHKEPRCDDPERSGSRVEVVGVVDGEAISTFMETCSAVLTDEDAGRIKLDFGVQVGRATLVVGLSYCLEDAARAYPLTFASRQATDQCPNASGFAIDRVGDGNFDYATPQGHWSILSLDTMKHGRVTGELELSLAESTRNELTVRGRYDLPVLRVPIEGTGLP